MRFQSLVKLISIGLLAIAGALLLSIGAMTRHTQAQSTVTATVQSASTPIAGIPITYTVQRGDTFNSIAQRFNLTPQQLQALNTISNVNVIRVGQVLTVSVSLLTPTVEPTQRPTLAPADTASRTATPAPTKASTATPRPTTASTATPPQTSAPRGEVTSVAVRTLLSYEEATPASPRPTYVPRATSVNKDLPPDVIVVGILLCLIVIGIILGLRLRL